MLFKKKNKPVEKDIYLDMIEKMNNQCKIMKEQIKKDEILPCRTLQDKKIYGEIKEDIKKLHEKIIKAEKLYNKQSFYSKNKAKLIITAAFDTIEKICNDEKKLTPLVNQYTSIT